MDRISVYLISVQNSPYWYAQWVIPGTTKRRTRSLRTADADEAERKRADLEYELNHGLAAPGRLSWQAFSERYEEEKLAGLKRYTRQKARSILDRFGRVIGPRSLAAVDSPMLSRYTGHLRSERFKAVTIQTHLAHLRAALTWAARQGLLVRVPNVESVKVSKKTRIRWIDKPTFDKLLSILPAGWGLLAQVAWYSGLRRTELYLLRWDRTPEGIWIDLNQARVWISAEACKADADQWVPIHPDLDSLLRRHQQTTGRVFVLHDSPCELSRHFCRMIKAAGMDITLQDLRRSFGTRYASLVPAQVLQRLMRHADIKTTMRYYADLDHALDEAIRRG